MATLSSDSPEDFEDRKFCPAGTLIISSEAWISFNSCLTSWNECVIENLSLVGVGLSSDSASGSGEGDCQPLTDLLEGVKTIVLAVG
jgi:hypothetical protein